MEKKLLSLLLVLCMVLCLVPTTAFAEENTDLTDTQVVETEGEKKADPPRAPEPGGRAKARQQRYAPRRECPGYKGFYPPR